MLPMSALANHRHERFAQEIALGSSPRAAYILCGYKDSPFSRPNASKLKHSPKVTARIAELVEEWGESCKVQLSWVQHGLLAIAEGRAVSRTVKNGKGELIEERDRLAALVALLRSLGVTDMTVNANAVAAAGAVGEVTDDDRKRALAALFAKFKAKAETVPLVQQTVQANETTAPINEPVTEIIDFNDYKYDL
jgi:hypothetical protein